jgi:hypothetical protein
VKKWPGGNRGGCLFLSHHGIIHNSNSQQCDDFLQPRLVDPKDFLLCKPKLVGPPVEAAACAIKNYDHIHVNYVEGLCTVFGTSSVSPVLHVNEGVLIGDGVGDQLLFLMRDTSTSCVPVAVAIIHVFLSAPTIYSVDVMFGMETDSLGNTTVLFIS